MKILNLGCGESKITGATNVDINPITGCELVFDIKKPFPLRDNSYDKVCFFHCIEHIEQQYHFHVLNEIWRVLEPSGILLLSYPEFSVIIKNWLDNVNADRHFWKATVYGRQKYPGDYHYTGIHTPDLIEELFAIGFGVQDTFSEPTQAHNTVIKCQKGERPLTYEEVLYKEIFNK